MTDEDTAILQQMRADLARLNESLERCRAAKIEVALQVATTPIVGSPPLTRISGRASRARFEFDERL